MIIRLFLGLQAVILVGYGLYCLVQPESLAGPAGISATSITGTIELQAMYGGLQTAIGVLCAIGMVSLSYRHPALVALLFVFAGLGVTRVSLGLVHGDYSAYTSFAMLYEACSLLFLLYLVPKFREQA